MRLLAGLNTRSGCSTEGAWPSLGWDDEGRPSPSLPGLLPHRKLQCELPLRVLAAGARERKPGREGRAPEPCRGQASVPMERPPRGRTPDCGAVRWAQGRVRAQVRAQQRRSCSCPESWPHSQLSGEWGLGEESAQGRLQTAIAVSGEVGCRHAHRSVSSHKAGRSEKPVPCFHGAEHMSPTSPLAPASESDTRLCSRLAELGPPPHQGHCSLTLAAVHTGGPFLWPLSQHRLPVNFSGISAWASLPPLPSHGPSAPGLAGRVSVALTAVHPWPRQGPGSGHRRPGQQCLLGAGSSARRPVLSTCRAH